MHSIDSLRDQIAFDHWANRRLNAALTDAAPDRARWLLGHVLAAQEIWMDRVEGAAPRASADGDSSVRDFGPLIEAAHDRLAGSLDATTEVGLDRTVEYADLAGNAFTTPLREIFVHVLHHGTYHRAQIASALKQANIEPPRTDYIVYWRDQKDSP